MKKKTYQINIPEPCNEDWNKMTPQEKGRFCGKCEKVIVDYSHQPDRVIAQAIKEGNGQICGRFRSDQLQRDIVFEPAFYQNTRWKAFGLMLSGLLAAGALKGQNNQNHLSATPSFEVSTNTSVKKDIQRPLKKEVKITGKLVDKDTSEALIAATIYVKNTDYGAVTDIEGIFELDIWLEPDWLENGLVLDASYTGYSNKEIKITKEVLQKYNNRIHLDATNLELDNSLVLPTIELMVDTSSYEELIVVGGTFHVTRTYYQDQTLYQWLRKKIIKKRVEKAEKQLQEEENKKEEILVKATKKAKTAILNTNEIISEPKIIQKVYPNPFKNELTIEIKVEQAETYDLVLFNELGQEIHRKTVVAISGINQFTLHLNENKLTAGTYLLSILNGKEILQTEIVIRQD